MDTFLKVLVKQKVWHYPDIDGLGSGKYQGLSELRWKCGRVPYRIIGYTAAERVFVMLIGCTHNERKYKPADCFDTALARKKEIERNQASTDEYKLVTNK